MLYRDKNVCVPGFWQTLWCFRLTGPLWEQWPITPERMSLPPRDEIMKKSFNFRKTKQFGCLNFEHSLHSPRSTFLFLKSQFATIQSANSRSFSSAKLMLPSAQYPFTCIRYVGGIIVASAGQNIYTFSATDGHKISTWPEDKSSASNNPETNEDSVERSEEPPEKRRKLSPTGAENKPTNAWQSVPILVISPSGRYVVAVTAEDKHVRVFEISTGGVLTESSDR